MTHMNTDFFGSNSYFIDEKVNVFKFENCYGIFNDNGQQIGMIKQKLSFAEKILRLVLSKEMLPFLLEIRNSNDELESSISRGWTFFMSKITIMDGQGNAIGTIKQKFTFFKPTFKIYDTSDQLVAEINGNFVAWDFQIKDPSNNQIGYISKKWAGGMKEIFTSADKYQVVINPGYSNKQNKIAIISAAITIDMVQKEKNNSNSIPNF